MILGVRCSVGQARKAAHVPGQGTESYPILRKGKYNMDSTLLDLFNSGGIPLLMAAYIYYQGKLHREEVSKLSEALNDQTKAVVEMTAKVEVLLNEYTRNIDEHVKGDKRS